MITLLLQTKSKLIIGENLQFRHFEFIRQIVNFFLMMFKDVFIN